MECSLFIVTPNMDKPAPHGIKDCASGNEQYMKFQENNISVFNNLPECLTIYHKLVTFGAKMLDAQFWFGRAFVTFITKIT